MDCGEITPIPANQVREVLNAVANCEELLWLDLSGMSLCHCLSLCLSLCLFIVIERQASHPVHVCQHTGNALEANGARYLTQALRFCPTLAVLNMFGALSARGNSRSVDSAILPGYFHWALFRLRYWTNGH
jgi:hypothetical protein